MIAEVAYLRFASVHRRFEEVDQFVDAIQALGRRVKPNSSQPELFGPEITGTHSGDTEVPKPKTKVETSGRV